MSEINSFDARYFKRVKERKKKTGGFTLFIESRCSLNLSLLD